MVVAEKEQCVESGTKAVKRSGLGRLGGPIGAETPAPEVAAEHHQTPPPLWIHPLLDFSSKRVFWRPPKIGSTGQAVLNSILTRIFRV